MALQEKLQNKKSIGLLGGSFNPAHEGHVHISRLACRMLELDEIWWLVSPQNPNKPKTGMAPFAERFAATQKTVDKIPEIKVSDFEKQVGTQYTIDTIAALQKKYPGCNFIWLMGADNLASFHKWHKWQEIFKSVPIAVFDRGNFAIEALASDAAHVFSLYKLPESRAKELAGLNPPAWSFLTIEKHPASSTEIRKKST